MGRQRGEKRTMKVGTKVKIKDNAMSRAWGIANEVGIVTGPDPSM